MYWVYSILWDSHDYVIINQMFSIHQAEYEYLSILLYLVR